MTITRYHLTTTEKINEFGGHNVISGTILENGTFRAVIDFEDTDAESIEFIENCMEEDDNILSYTSSTM